MISIGGLILSFFLIGQTSSYAQYEKLTRGQRVNFDTAVAIRIDVYRLESRKLKLGGKLIDSLALTMRSLSREIESGDSLMSLYKLENRAFSKRLKEKDSVSRIYYNHSAEMEKVAIKCLENQPRKWGQDPKTWGLAGAFLALLINSLK